MVVYSVFHVYHRNNRYINHPRGIQLQHQKWIAPVPTVGYPLTTLRAPPPPLRFSSPASSTVVADTQ